MAHEKIISLQVYGLMEKLDTDTVAEKSFGVLFPSVVSCESFSYMCF